MTDPNGNIIGHGYSGKDWGKNAPATQSVENIGPIPEGLYFVGEPRNTEKHGRYFLPLTPDPSNQMFGRSAFGIHGERMEGPPGNASEGCIIQEYTARVLMGVSADRDLKVVSGLPPVNPSPQDPAASPIF